MPDSVLPNPYIGPTAFTEQDSERFFGRAEETRELASLIIARRAVLLYAQSGSGKTSLLQASLIPELKRRKRVRTFPIARVMGTSVTFGNLYTGNALANLFSDAPGSIQEKTLSQAFGAALATDSKERPQPHLVIFDQFEEIFTFHPELTDQRREFFEQLGGCLATYPQLSLLLSMREDYLAELEVYTALLPDRIRTRMRLERLGVESAVEAIRKPALLAGMPFAPGTAEELVDNLRRIRSGTPGANGFAMGQYVEPVQLQIVCRQLWSRLSEDTSRHKSQIDAEDVKTYANVDDALIYFYRDSLVKAQQTGVTERALRRWFDERLITAAGTRGLVYRGDRETGGLPNAAVDILRDCYMIRADLRGGDVWYELAHDRLVEPVRQDNLAWKANYRNPIADALERGPDNFLTGLGLAAGLQYAKENPQDLTQEERQFLRRSEQEDRKARTRRRTLIGSGAAVIVVLSILAIWARLEAGRAQANAAEGERQRSQAIEQENLAKKSAQDADQERKRAEEQRGLAEQQKQIADVARDEAENQAVLATSGRLATSAVLNQGANFDLAALLSVQARRAADTFEGRSSLLSTLLQAVEHSVISVLHHHGALQCVAFSPDSRLLASASEDGTVRLWETTTYQPLGAPLKSLSEEWVRSVAFSPDGKLLASAGDDAKVRLWDVATHRLLGETLDNSSKVSSIAFSPDGKLLASAGYDGAVRLWDPAKHRLLGDPIKRDSEVIVTAVAFAPNGKMLASADINGAVRLWDPAKHQLLGELKHPSLVWSVAFSPDGKLLASASEDRGVRFWDVLKLQMVGVPLVASESAVNSVAFNHDGTVLASAGDDAKVRLWNVATHQQFREFTGHMDAVQSVAFSLDGMLLASAGHDKTVRLWGERRDRPLALPPSVSNVELSPDGKILASAGLPAALSPDPLIPVQLWDLATHQPRGDPLAGYFAPVEFGPGGKIFAAAGLRGTVQFWDVAKHQPLGDLHGGSIRIDLVAFNPDGTMLALACSDGKLRLWDVANHKLLGDPLKGHSGGAFSVAFSPDGKLLASGGSETGGIGVVRLWDVARHQQLGDPLNGHERFVNKLAFSPNGKLLASAGYEGTVRLWNVATRQPMGDPLIAEGGVAFSPDGALLATGGPDSTVQLWDVAARRLLGGPLTGHSNRVASVAFSPNGKLLLSASAESVRPWDIDPNSWAAQLCTIANRNLSLAEWQQFIGPGVPYQRTCANLPPGEGVPGK